MPQNDPRRRYTQSILKEAGTLLLKKKAVEKITVDEVCKTAKVSWAKTP